MHDVQTSQEGLLLEAQVTRRVTHSRLVIGLLQGLLLYWLSHAVTERVWPYTQELAFTPLLLVSLLAPVALISGLGHLSTRQAVRWFSVVVIVLGALAEYAVWRSPAGSSPLPNFHLYFWTAAALFIAHAMVLAGSAEGRRFATYPTYFEFAWKLLVQHAFSLFFVGALWAVLLMGAQLFMLVKLPFLRELMAKPWFFIPVSTFAFACALHLTDVRPGIVRGIRSMLLVLLSWILPLTSLLAAGFLLTLPFTGLESLWATRHATALLLAVSAMLVVFVNAAFQNGQVAAGVPLLIRHSSRLAALCLPFLVAIAVYALALRVIDHGWTIDRILAAACLLVAAVYAGGYAWAACQRTEWMARMAPVNVANAVLVVVVLLALLSPLADPARLSVAHQLARLESGKVAADRFDYAWLRKDGARWGQAALEKLQKDGAGAQAALVREKAKQALALPRASLPWEKSLPVDTRSALQVWPAGAALPASFLQEKWDKGDRRFGLPACLTQTGQRCDAYLVDVTGDGTPEIILVGLEKSGGQAVLAPGKDGSWEVLANLPYGLAGCESVRLKMQAGDYKTVTPKLRDLEIGGERVTVRERGFAGTFACPDNAPAEK